MSSGCLGVKQQAKHSLPWTFHLRRILPVMNTLRNTQLIHRWHGIHRYIQIHHELTRAITIDLKKHTWWKFSCPIASACSLEELVFDPCDNTQPLSSGIHYSHAARTNTLAITIFANFNLVISATVLWNSLTTTLKNIGEQLRSPEVFIASWKIGCIMETFELPNSVHIVVLMNMHSGMIVCQCVNSWHYKLCTLIPWETCIALLLQIIFSLLCIIECGIQL